MPFETPITIEELLRHKSKFAFVEPLVQRDVYNCVCAVCNEYNIKLNIIDGFLRGMPYHYVIKKIEPKGDGDIENKFVSKETNMSVIDLFKNDNINIEEKNYDIGLDTSINNSRVGMSNDKINLENPMDFFINNFMDKNEEVEFRDNKKDIIYSIQKNGNYYNLKVEKMIRANSSINSLFDQIKGYSNLVKNYNDFWPNSNFESPDLLILWEIITRFKNETNKMNGSLKYPENWDEVISKIREQIISAINEEN